MLAPSRKLKTSQNGVKSAVAARLRHASAIAASNGTAINVNETKRFKACPKRSSEYSLTSGGFA